MAQWQFGDDAEQELRDVEFKPSPATLNNLKKSATTDHTVCVCIIDLIVVIAVIVLCVLVMILWVPGRVASG